MSSLPLRPGLVRVHCVVCGATTVLRPFAGQTKKHLLGNALCEGEWQEGDAPERVTVEPTPEPAEHPVSHPVTEPAPELAPEHEEPKP